MNYAEHTKEQLTPEQRRERLRAFADRMLIALSNVDDPETGDDVVKGVRLALMIERLYARCDVSESLAHKRAIENIEHQRTLKNRLEFTEDQMQQKLSVPFVTLSQDALARQPQTHRSGNPFTELRAQMAAMQVDLPSSRTQPDIAVEALALKAKRLKRAAEGDKGSMREILGGLMSEDDLEAFLALDDDDTS